LFIGLNFECQFIYQDHSWAAWPICTWTHPAREKAPFRNHERSACKHYYNAPRLFGSIQTMNAPTPLPHAVGNNAAINKDAEDIGIPLSTVIRERIKRANKRFHANDNIAEFLNPGDVERLQDEVRDKMQGVLESLVIDTESDHNTNETARRVAKMFIQEVFHGRYKVEPAVTEFPNISHLNELMIVGPILVRSACSHHLCPIIGRVWVGVMPNEHSNLIGLSKYTRLIDWVMSRPQIQEEAVSQVADLLQSRLQPDGLAIVMEADHFCMHWRGVKDTEAKMINSVMRGSFLKDANLRREFLSLINNKKG
jgi:GTP cyclohydrolase IA